MSNIKRKLKRQIQKSNGELVHKKAVAKKMGCTLSELEKRMERRERNLREITGGKYNGR